MACRPTTICTNFFRGDRPVPVPDVVILLECLLLDCPEKEVLLFDLAPGGAYWSRRCRGVASKSKPILWSVSVVGKSLSG
jgi:hypothetical protein